MKERKTLPALRWWIGGLLFLSTVINYIDRQTLNALGPYLKLEYKWNNTDFALVLLSFRVAYTIMQSITGRLLDWLGTRRGLALSVTFYSIVAMLTAAARGFWSFCTFRFLLGSGEAANWPGATKAVSEWFPAKERGWAVALFDSGSSIGGAVAPFIILFLYGHFGSWRPAFLITGSLGFLWLIAWLSIYRPPEQHPRLRAAELRYIQEGRPSAPDPKLPGVGWGKLLKYRQAWGIILGRMLLDPYWFFVSEWFAILLVSRGFKMEQSILGFWAPFLGADLGNFFGGALSSFWISRGWPVGKARRGVLWIFGPTMLILALAVLTSAYVPLILLFAYSTFAYAACSTIFLAFPADVFHTRAVASVSGLSGTGAGIGTLITTYLIGRISDRYSFEPIILAASVVPCLAVLVMVTMVRAPKRPDPEGILNPF